MNILTIFQKTDKFEMHSTPLIDAGDSVLKILTNKDTAFSINEENTYYVIQVLYSTTNPVCF